VRRFDLGQDREKKNSITKKVTCVLYFPYLGGSLRWADSTLKLHGGWCRRHNHVCRVSNWNLHGLRFYRGSNFPIDFSMGLTTVQRYCAACDKAIYWSKIAIFHTSLVFDATIRGSPSDYCFPAWFGITRMMGLPEADGENSLTICLPVFTECTNVTDRPTQTKTDWQTDTAWRQRPRLMQALRGKKHGHMFEIFTFK